MEIAINIKTSPGNQNRTPYNLVESMRSTGNIRSTEWLFKRARRGFIRGVSQEDAVNFADTIDSMISVLNKVHEDRWDFHLKPERVGSRWKFELWVLIHYPVVEITNAEGLSHTMKDLILTFRINEQGIEDDRIIYGPEELGGTRGTLSYEEWFSHYIHSHLDTWRTTRFSDCLEATTFCTGGGEINDLMATLRGGYSEGIFELFILTLDVVANWESLEGGPHILMKNITLGTYDNYAELLDEGTLRRAYRYFSDSLSELNVNFVIADNRYKIKHDDTYEQYVKEKVIANTGEYVKYLLVNKVGTEYVGYNFPDIKTPEELKEKFLNDRGELPYTLIQGKKIEFKVEKFTGEMPDINQYGVHPKFLNYVSKKLEHKLYKKTIRRSSIERYNQSINA